jgi:hypothetical protein
MDEGISKESQHLNKLVFLLCKKKRQRKEGEKKERKEERKRKKERKSALGVIPALER